MSGTTPDPPPTSSTGVVSSPSHTNQPPIGPRTSNWSPTSATSPGTARPRRRRSGPRSARAGHPRRRRDRVAPLRLIPVVGGEPDVDVLPGPMPGQPGTSRRSVVVRTVSGIVSATVAPASARRSVTPVALLAPGVAVVVVAGALPEAGYVLVAQPQSATHLALFQKYRWGTSSRAGPPCSGSRSSPSKPYATQACHPARRPAAGSSCSRRRRRRSRTRRWCRSPSSSVSTETPSQRVPSFDHFVTQWMSTVGVSAGRLRNSSHVQRAATARSRRRS